MSQQDAATGLATAIREVQQLVSGDGATLRSVLAERMDRTVVFDLDLRAVTCVECVMPPDILLEMVTAVVHRQLGDNAWRVVVRDPRRSSNAGGACQ